MSKQLELTNIYDSRTGNYLGQALVCSESCECAHISIGPYSWCKDCTESFLSGAKYGGTEITINNIDMPIFIDSLNTPYNEVRNTVVGEFKRRQRYS